MFLDETIEDEKIAKVLIGLSEDNMITKQYNWDSILDFVNPKKRAKTVNELIRHKYLFGKETEVKDYGFNKLTINAEEYERKEYSKAYLFKTYLGRDVGPVPVTYYDKVQRQEVQKVVKKKFKNTLSKRGVEIEKKVSKDNILCITGNENYLDKKEYIRIVTEEIVKLPEAPTIIGNGVINEIDLFTADFTLKNKFKSFEFVPDFTINGEFAIDVNLRNMIKMSKYLIIFVDKNIPNNPYLKAIELAEKQNIICVPIYFNDNRINLDDLF
jgi:hypothetical protein